MRHSISVGNQLNSNGLVAFFDSFSSRCFAGEPTVNLIPSSLNNDFSTRWAATSVTVENRGDFWKMQTTGVDSGNGRSFIRLPSSNISYSELDSVEGQQRSISIDVKPVTHYKVILSAQNDSNFGWPTGVVFDLDRLAKYPITNYDVTSTGKIQKLKYGWFRISISLTTSDNYNGRGNGFTLGFSNNTQTNSSSRQFIGDGSEVIFIKNAQAEEKDHTTAFTPSSRNNHIQNLHGNYRAIVNDFITTDERGRIKYTEEGNNPYLVRCYPENYGLELRNETISFVARCEKDRASVGGEFQTGLYN